jgi:hypothetical protein
MSEVRVTLVDGKLGETNDLQPGNLVEISQRSLDHFLLCCISRVTGDCLYGSFIDLDACDFPKASESGDPVKLIPFSELRSIKVHALAGRELFIRLSVMVSGAQAWIGPAKALATFAATRKEYKSILVDE